MLLLTVKFLMQFKCEQTNSHQFLGLLAVVVVVLVPGKVPPVVGGEFFLSDVGDDCCVFEKIEVGPIEDPVESPDAVFGVELVSEISCHVLLIHDGPVAFPPFIPHVLESDQFFRTATPQLNNLHPNDVISAMPVQATFFLACRHLDEKPDNFSIALEFNLLQLGEKVILLFNLAVSGPILRKVVGQGGNLLPDQVFGGHHNLTVMLHGEVPSEHLGPGFLQKLGPDLWLLAIREGWGWPFAMALHRDEIVNQNSRACTGKIHSVDAYFGVDAICDIIAE